MMELSTEQFVRIRDVIYKKLGLFFEDSKVYFLKRRVQTRMEALDIQDPASYLFLLAQADPEGVEMQQLANLITTHETYMFREHEQLAAFANYCLPEMLEAKLKRGDNTLNIWSAGCSSGEEPYTLAMILREVIPPAGKWRIQITATDIDQDILQLVKQGRYSQRSVKDVPAEYRQRHLTQVGDEFLVRPETKGLVTPRHLNLNDRTAMRQMRGFDFVFCRNVLIYFDDASRKAAVDHFYNALNPDGFIFLGHSESIGRITNAFKLRRVAEHLVYCKAA
jgi:chemotaxis protein methyltransferase CheR